MPESGTIHRFVPGSAESPLVLLLLHGTGGNENDLLNLGHMMAPGAGLLSPRGKILENGMPRFFRRVAEGVFDEADLIKRTHELAAFVEEARKRYELNGKQLIAVGYSNGANIAASLLLLRPETLDAAILFRAMVPLTPSELPKLSGKSILLLAGANDQMISPELPGNLARILEDSGADVTLHWNPAGHQLTPDEIKVASDWLRSRCESRMPPS